MRGGTGVFADVNDVYDLMGFLGNSNKTYVTQGSYGFTFMAKINDPSYIPPYKYLDVSSFGKSVNKILIKISILKYKPGLDGIVREITEKSFNDEVNIQTDIFLKTMNNLQPLCPAMVYAKAFTDPTNEEYKDLYHELAFSIDEMVRQAGKDTMKGQMLTKVLNTFNDAEQFSVIAMEYADGYDMLHRIFPHVKIKPGHPINWTHYFNEIKSNNNYVIILHATIYILLELAIKAGYAHSDFHFGNIMVNTNDPTYFKGENVSIMLIDFGFAHKLSENYYSKIKDLYKQGSYLDAFKVLCDVKRSDGFDLHHDAYLLCKYYDEYIKNVLDNNIIQRLITEKEEATNDIIHEFNSKTDRSIYPLLPLSNEMKHNMFPGITDNNMNNKELDKIIFNADNLKYINGFKFKQDIEYINNVIYKLSLYGFSPEGEHPILTYLIKACYVFVYLITQNNIIMASNNSLNVSFINKLRYVAICMVGLRKEFSEEYSSVYEMVSRDNFLDNMINKYGNVHVVSILDYMNNKEYDDLNQIYVDGYFYDLTNNVQMYENPENWVKKKFKRMPENNMDGYEFPHKEEGDVFGGKIRRRRIKTKKTNKKRRKTRRRKRII